MLEIHGFYVCKPYYSAWNKVLQKLFKTSHKTLSFVSKQFCFFTINIHVLDTGDSRWLELHLSKFLNSQSKTAVPFLFSIEQSKFTPDLSKFSISQTKPWVPLHSFHCFSALSLKVLIANTRSPIKCVINTGWAYHTWITVEAGGS